MKTIPFVVKQKVVILAPIKTSLPMKIKLRIKKILIKLVNFKIFVITTFAPKEATVTTLLPLQLLPVPLRSASCAFAQAKVALLPPESKREQGATFSSFGAKAQESCSLLLLQKQEAQEAMEGTCG
jgi:hypothetical protein